MAAPSTAQRLRPPSTSHSQNEELTRRGYRPLRSRLSCHLHPPPPVREGRGGPQCWRLRLSPVATVWRKGDKIPTDWTEPNSSELPPRQRPQTPSSAPLSRRRWCGSAHPSGGPDRRRAAASIQQTSPVCCSLLRLPMARIYMCPKQRDRFCRQHRSCGPKIGTGAPHYGHCTPDPVLDFGPDCPSFRTEF
jgi:hypothetical protein